MVGNQKTDFKLDESISSLQDLKSLILEVRDYARWYEHSAIKKQVGAKSRKKTPAPVLTPPAQTLISKWSGKDFDPLIATLEDYAANAPQFTIVLAAPASGSLKKTIVKWCRANLEPNLLINFQFNSTILGGMVVRFGSHVYDWSFKQQLMANAQKFPEILRRV